MATQVTTAQANKILQAALFTEAQRSASLINAMTDEAPKSAKVNNGKQTSFTAPVVRVSDLTKNAGDEVSMQLFHQLNGRPTIGDKKVEGRLESLSQTDFAIKINQTRHGVDAGGKMSQQRTKHDLRATARTLLSDGWYGRYLDQVGMVHLAGARGDYTASDIIVPLASDEEFAQLLINGVNAPSYGRHFFGGDATSFSSIDAADKFTLGCVDDMALSLAEMVNPLQPVRFQKDPTDGEPLYLLMVTPRQWNDFYTSTSTDDWKLMVANSVERSKGWDHPLFRGEKAMWRNILIRPYRGMPIRFNQGSTVNVCAANSTDGAETQVTAGTMIDRAVLLGAQALANAFGSGVEGGQFFMSEEKTDHGNSTEIVIGWMGGLKKIRFTQKDGYVQDHGCMVLDTAVSL